MNVANATCAPAGETNWDRIEWSELNYNVKRPSVSIAKVNGRVPNRAFGRPEPSAVKIARSGS